VGDDLGTKVNADWVEEGVGEEIGEGEDKVGVGHSGDVEVLVQEINKDIGYVELRSDTRME